MINDTLSIIPYYGGKARMAPLICDMLDYNDSEIYIEPFGGGARVLLNKARHKVDIYCDSSLGLNALFECLSKEDTGYKLIDELLDTEPSEELFEWALEYRNSFDDDLQTIAYNHLKKYVKQMSTKYSLPIPKTAFRGHAASKTPDMYTSNALAEIEPLRKKMSPTENEEFLSLCRDYLEVYNSSSVNENGTSYYNDIIELAKATFIVYQLSYNATGRQYCESRGENVDGYYGKINALYKAIEQLEGIQTICTDAKTAFLQEIETAIEVDGDIDLTEFIASKYLLHPKVMMYLDPTYLQAKVRKKDDGTPCDRKCTDACKAFQAEQDKIETEKDLGKSTYKQSWGHMEHEMFLKLIYKAKCKILVSNYDVCLYNRYLNEANGWHRVEFETTTTAAQSSTKDNSRTEVLWYNY